MEIHQSQNQKRNSIVSIYVARPNVAKARKVTSLSLSPAVSLTNVANVNHPFRFIHTRDVDLVSDAISVETPIFSNCHGWR